jgi:DNA adenine methylase
MRPTRQRRDTGKGDRSLPIGQPFLRWAGSKRKLLPRLLPYWGAGYDRYIEPFAGSAALFFAIQPKRALLSDINPDLITALSVIRSNPAFVYQQAQKYPANKRTFYRLRALDPSLLTPIERVARFFFLNRFCFNGLYRTDRSGRFNVPFAGQKTGNLPLWEQFSTAASLLKRSTVRCGDFERVLRSSVRAGDFVYLDPTYAVANRRVFRHRRRMSAVLDVQFTDDTISVNLRDGRVITVPLVWCPRLLEATPSQRKNWKIAGGGYGIHWPDIDEDLSTEGLLRGVPVPKS